MGFDKDRVVVIDNPYSYLESAKRKGLQNLLYHDLAANPAVAAYTSAIFKFGSHNNNTHIIAGKEVELEELGIDYNYFSFNKIKLVAGRNFSPDIKLDSAEITLTEAQKIPKNSTANKAVIVNETLYKLLGKPALAQFNRQMGGVIIGVCKDYHTDDLTKKITPAYHVINTYAPVHFWVKIKAGQSIPATLDKIRNDWNKLTGSSPFTFTFMDEDVQKSYEVYLRWMDTVNISCFIAILISCLGLFGLSAITTLNRTKEIGIRKILGASVSDLFLLINRSTFALALFAFIIAAPIALYLVNAWLDNFAYRIKVDWRLFAGAGILTMLTAVIAVSYHTMKAARANPSNSLRNE